MKNNKHKKILFTLLLSIQLLSLSFTVAYGKLENENPSMMDKADGFVSKGDLAKVGNLVDQFGDDEFLNAFKDFDLMAIMKDATMGKINFSPKGILEGVSKLIFSEISMNIKLLSMIIAIAVLSALLGNIKIASGHDGVEEAAFFICFILMAALSIRAFKDGMSLASGVVDNTMKFMQSVFPLMISLLIAGGSLTTAGAFSPVFSFLSNTAGMVMNNLLLPLVTLSGVVSIIDNISEQLDLSGIYKFIKQCATWVLGITMTIFTAFLLIQSGISASTDGIAGKTAKYAVSNFIPVVGKYLSDAADTVVGCSLLIKNAAGLGILLGILSVCLIPLVKIVGISLTFKAAGAITGPIGDKRISKVLEELGDLVMLLFAASTCMCLLFLISVAVMLGASNFTAAIR